VPTLAQYANGSVKDWIVAVTAMAGDTGSDALGATSAGREFAPEHAANPNDIKTDTPIMK